MTLAEQEPLDSSTNNHDNPLLDLLREHNAVMLFIDSGTGRILDANHAAERFYGYSLIQLKDMFIADIRLPHSIQEGNEETSYFVCRHKLAGGENRTVEVHSSPLVVDGKPVNFCIIHDVTGHKRTESEYERLLKSEQQAHQVTETLRAANLALARALNLDVVLEIFLEFLQQLIPYDSANVMLMQDDARLAIHAMRGYGKFTNEALTRALVFDPLIHLAFAPIISEKHSFVIPDTRLFPGWDRLPGTEHVISWMGVPLIAGGRIIGIYSIDKTEVGFFTEEHQKLAEALAGQAAVAIQNARLFTHVQDELAERKHTESALRESEERYRSLFDSMMDGIYRSTPAGKFVDVNPAMVRMFGFASREEMLAVDIKKELYFAPEERGSHILDTGQEETEVYRMRRKDGTEIWVEDHGYYVHNEQGEVIYHAGLLRDVTERKRAETSLHSRTQELETLFAISNHISFVQTETEILPQILKELGRAVHADTMAVILLEPDETRLSIVNASGDLIPNIGFTFNVTEGISGSILKSRHIYQTEDLSNDPMRIKEVYGMDHLGPAIFTPVLSGDHLIGVLLSARRKGKHVNSFTPEATRLIITASEMLGNAINRVRLHLETMRRLDHLQTLRTLDQVIASSLDLRITLNILLNHTITQLGVDAADVFLFYPYQQTLQFAAGQGFRTRTIEGAEIHLYDAFAGRCVMERRIIQVFDPSEVVDNKPFVHLWIDEDFFSYTCVPLIAKGEVKGVLEVYRRSPFIPDAEWLEFLETLAGQAAITIDNSQMFDNLQHANMELAIAYDATIEGWSRAMDLRDKETEGHTWRVTELTIILAKAMGARDKEILHIRRGALLHDIGKMGIPDHILLKEGPLTDDEWIIMRTHPILAYEMIRPIRYLHQSLDIPMSHHEKWDGTGYPRQLKGETIPLVARIFAVVDVWDALTSSRPYRKAWTKKKTLAFIKKQSGKHFDPQVVEAFLKVIK